MSEFIQQINGNGHHPAADPAAATDTTKPKIEKAQATPRPAPIEEFYLESQTKQGVKEQEKAYEGNAEKEASEPEKTVASLAFQVEQAKGAAGGQVVLADGERKRFEVRLSALGQHCRRRLHATLVYWLVRVLIILGDLAGASGAILILGEEPFNAFAQATSVAVSAVVLGVVGTEVRHWVAATSRQKPVEELTEDEKACASFFSGADSFAVAIKILALVFIAGVAAIVGGIFTLREAAEGQGVAIAFGCFSLVVCLASFLNSYEYACEVSDYLATANSWRQRLGKEATTASTAAAISRHDEAAAEVRTIHARNRAEADAAGHGLLVEMYERFQKQPGLFGHGTGRERD